MVTCLDQGVTLVMQQLWLGLDLDHCHFRLLTSAFYLGFLSQMTRDSDQHP